MFARAASTDRFLGAAIIALTLLVHGPLFVRSPLGPDPVMYDLQAQLVQDGGVLYRDILEPNLPGAVWLHLGVRSIAGWSTEVLRAFDLGLFCLSAWLVCRLLRIDGVKRSLFIAFLIAGYSTLSEWCHCQRDVWMLPFVLGAMSLRMTAFKARGQICSREGEALVSRIRNDGNYFDKPSAGTDRDVDLASSAEAGGGSIFSIDRFAGCGSAGASPSLIISAVLEGMCWGAAVWLKPHVVVPAGCVVVISLLLVIRSGGSLRASLIRETGVLLGGAIIGLAGLAWLVAHDAWQPLWNMLTEWNRDYVAASATRWSWGRLWSIQERLAPWSLVHVLAIPAAVWGLCRTWPLWQTAPSPSGGVESDHGRALLSALYLGWLAQTFLLQHLFDYVHVPALLLGAAVVASMPWPRFATGWSPRQVAAASAFVMLPALLVRGDQLKWWLPCVQSPTTPAMQAALARLPLPEWNHLARVEQFLRGKGVRDGELTTYHTHTIHLYPALRIRPATRFVFTETHLRLFPSRAGEIAESLGASRQRFVVSDLLAAGIAPESALDDAEWEDWRSVCPGGALAAFPFDQPVVLRSGPYLVHEVTGPIGPVETRFFPLAAKTAGL